MNGGVFWREVSLSEKREMGIAISFVIVIGSTISLFKKLDKIAHYPFPLQVSFLCPDGPRPIKPFCSGIIFKPTYRLWTTDYSWFLHFDCDLFNPS